MDQSLQLVMAAMQQIATLEAQVKQNSKELDAQRADITKLQQEWAFEKGADTAAGLLERVKEMEAMISVKAATDAEQTALIDSLREQLNKAETNVMVDASTNKSNTKVDTGGGSAIAGQSVHTGSGDLNS